MKTKIKDEFFQFRFCGMILGEGFTAEVFFAYFLQLHAKSKRGREGGRLGEVTYFFLNTIFSIKGWA
jgi:hypothetical protein